MPTRKVVIEIETENDYFRDGKDRLNRQSVVDRLRWIAERFDSNSPAVAFGFDVFDPSGNSIGFIRVEE